ncbi:MAG: hypothetical protein QM765_12225 [Myxococcales bacterium]
MARSIYIVALLLPACGGASLKDYETSDLTLDLTVEGHVALSLGAGGSPGACRRLEGPVRATLNGREMRVDSYGGEVVTTEGWFCSAPEFSAARSETEDGDALVEISDGRSRVVLRARNAFAERAISGHGRRADGSWSFLWAPATDVGTSAVWRLDDESGAHFGQVAILGSELLLDLSAENLARGTLRVDGLGATPIDQCEGVASCRCSVRASSGEIRLSGGIGGGVQ